MSFDSPRNKRAANISSGSGKFGNLWN